MQALSSQSTVVILPACDRGWKCPKITHHPTIGKTPTANLFQGIFRIFRKITPKKRDTYHPNQNKYKVIKYLTLLPFCSTFSQTLGISEKNQDICLRQPTGRTDHLRTSESVVRPLVAAKTCTTSRLGRHIVLRNRHYLWI